MKLYHFTAAHLLDKIKIEGLTLGVIPVRFRPVKFLRPYQWLTSNPNWNQSWTDETGSIGYPRNVYRLTINIPGKARRNLHNWIRFGELNVPSNVLDTLNAYGDPENWHVFSGKINPSWVVEIVQNPSMTREIAA